MIGSVNDYFYWLQNIGLHETLDLLETPARRYHELERKYSDMVDIHFRKIHDRLDEYDE